VSKKGAVARIKLLGVRFSAGEFVRIAVAANALGIRPTAWVRHKVLCALDGKPELPARFQAPPAAKPPARLTRTAGTRFTEPQFEALAAHARACGLTTTAFIRQVILGVKPVARIPDSRAAIVAINRVGNNLNQLVKLAHSGVVLTPELLRVIHDVLGEIRTMRDALLDSELAHDRQPET
jgi:hypothetical protein